MKLVVNLPDCQTNISVLFSHQATLSKKASKLLCGCLVGDSLQSGFQGRQIEKCILHWSFQHLLKVIFLSFLLPQKRSKTCIMYKAERIICIFVIIYQH